MGRRPHLQDEVPHARETKARWRRGRQHQETCLEILPAEDRTRPHWTVPALGQSSARCPVLVVQVPRKRETTCSRCVRNGKCSRRFCGRRC